MIQKRNRQSNRIGVISTDNTQEEATGTPTGFLSKLFRKIFSDLGYYDLTKWHMLLEQYVKDPINNIPQNRVKMATARSNLQKELFKSKMSWNVFIKGMRFMGLKSIEVRIIAHHQNGLITEHSMPLVLSATMIEEDDEELNQLNSELNSLYESKPK